MQATRINWLLRAALAALLAAGALTSALGQPASARPVRFIVPLGPGSGSDTLTRLVAKLAAAELGPTLVENKPGADTLVAIQDLLASPADGRTVMMLSPTSLVINPLLNDQLPYDARRDLRPVVGMIRTTAVLVVGGNSRFNKFADVVAAARASPQSVSMANYSPHYRLGAMQMQQMAHVEFNQVPYKTPSQVQTDLIGGAVDMALMDIGGAMPFITAGKLKVLASTGAERHPKLPDVPTLREAGLEKYDLYGWISLGVSAKTPDAVVQALEAVLLRAVKHPDFVTYATQTAGAEVFPINSKELSDLVASDTARYRQFAKDLDATRK